MAQKTAQQTRLIAERVRALATILLTRREDVSISEVTEDFGLDLIATIIHEDKPGLRQFGVTLKGVWAKATAAHADAVLKPSMQRMLRYGPFPFPVAIFFYTMENGEGWYTWAGEPVLASDGGFEIRPQGEASCRPLGEVAVNEIIDRVDAWYDAFYSRTNKAISKQRK